jgi:P27 family predicted phage terminase small subunit
VWLDREAKREWRRVAPELERLGMLTRVDMAALAGYCQSYARWKQAEKVLSELGTTFVTEKGYLMPRPEVAVARTSLQMVRAFCAEFGLTPSARGRMTVPEPEYGEEESPFDV